ncbi:MAG: hypothetical protein V7741_13340 [Hyphomonas sp.]
MTRKTDSKTVLFASASALAIGLFGQTAWAQDSDAPESTRTLATVTVTTQKTEQSVQDVPIAVSAFDEDAINRLQLTGGADLVKAVPNVSSTRTMCRSARTSSTSRNISTLSASKSCAVHRVRSTAATRPAAL